MNPRIQELIAMINKALTMEHAAAVQYLTHSELVFGPESGPIMEQLREQASDEQKHAENLRTLISDYLKGVPAYDEAQTKTATDYDQIIIANIASENEAIVVYEQIYQKIQDIKVDIGKNYFTLEHDIRHILMEEAGHITELERIQ